MVTKTILSEYIYIEKFPPIILTISFYARYINTKKSTNYKNIIKIPRFLMVNVIIIREQLQLKKY